MKEKEMFPCRCSGIFHLGEKCSKMLKISTNVVLQRLAREIDFNQGKLGHMNALTKQMEGLCDTSVPKSQLQKLNSRMYNVQMAATHSLSELEEVTEDMDDFENELARLRGWMDETRSHLTMRDASTSLKEQLATQEVM